MRLCRFVRYPIITFLTVSIIVIRQKYGHTCAEKTYIKNQEKNMHAKKLSLVRLIQGMASNTERKKIMNQLEDRRTSLTNLKNHLYQFAYNYADQHPEQ